MALALESGSAKSSLRGTLSELMYRQAKRLRVTGGHGFIRRRAMRLAMLAP
jgi:hypothetical protein